MAEKEKGFFVPHQPAFQPVIGYKDIEKSPSFVVSQTHALLRFFYQGIIQEMIRNSKPAEDYLHDYTLGYLKAAEEGSSTLYNQIGGVVTPDIDLETREAAHYAFVVMANLPDMAKSPYLAKGFSRKGMLKAPTTQRQFLARIKELIFGIQQVVAGKVKPHVTLEAYPPLLRTFKFFEVGNELPVKLTDDEREQEELEREKINKLLDGIDISF